MSPIFGRATNLNVQYFILFGLINYECWFLNMRPMGLDLGKSITHCNTWALVISWVLLGNDLLHILMMFHLSYIHSEVCFLKYLIKLVAWSLLIIYHPLFPQWNYFDRFFVCTERVSCNNQVGQQKCIPRTFSRFHRKASSTWLFNSKNVFFFFFGLKNIFHHCVTL